MQASHQNFIGDVSRESAKTLSSYGELSQLNVLWAGVSSYQTLITQEEIDTVPSLAGLTKAELDGAVFALEQIRGHMADALPALTKLAKLP